MDKLHAFEKISISDYEHESLCSSSSKEGGISKLGSGKLLNLNSNHNSKKSKQNSERSFNH